MFETSGVGMLRLWRQNTWVILKTTLSSIQSRHDFQTLASYFFIQASAPNIRESPCFTTFNQNWWNVIFFWHWEYSNEGPHLNTRVTYFFNLYLCNIPELNFFFLFPPLSVWSTWWNFEHQQPWAYIILGLALRLLRWEARVLRGS